MTHTHTHEEMTHIHMNLIETDRDVTNSEYSGYYTTFRIQEIMTLKG